MGYLSVAALLQCSPSAARQYLYQLRDAAVVSFRPGRRVDCADCGNYSLNADPAVAQNFFATLAESACSARISVRTNRPKHAGIPGAPYFHIMDGDILPLRMSNAPARRDPLVVALFGEAA